MERPSGKLVALEGDVESISTHLRLLPPSPKILILPSPLDSLPDRSREDRFNARAFVRDVHTTFLDRTRTARSFLESSTTAHPRVVFMNGGSVTARTTCISKISENLTNGNLEEAERLFNEIVRDGVAGLVRSEDVVSEDHEDVDKHTEGGSQDLLNGEEVEEDPVSKAMKAADSLDRETALLQAEYTESENNATGDEDYQADSRRSSRIGVRGIAKSWGNASTRQPSNDIVRTVLTVPIGRKVNRVELEALGRERGHLTAPLTPTRRSSYAQSYQSGDFTADDDEDEEDESFTSHLVSPGDTSVAASPRPMPGVVYGEARVVDVQCTSPEKPVKVLRKVKSMDRFYPSNSNVQIESPTPPPLHHTKSAYDLRKRPTTAEAGLQPEFRRSAFFQSPRSPFVKASRTTIRRPSMSPASLLLLMKPSSEARVFIDRGTDAGESPFERAIQSLEDCSDEPVEPIFELVEDLVIYFAGDDSNEILQSVLLAYKNGCYSTPNIVLEKEPSTPSVSSASNSSRATADSDNEDCIEQQEFDPYSSHNEPTIRNAQLPGRKNLSITDSAVQDLELSTPSINPPSRSATLSTKFCDFSPANRNSVIGIQNSFREFLALLFPTGENGYTQSYFTSSQESDRLWKSVWRSDEGVSMGSEGRTVDQIIALGCEDGVKQDFFCSVAGQVERLGNKRDGPNRSGRLDISYLISNAMQTYSTHIVNTEGAINPLSNPTLLAELLIPHLEAYLATNDAVRLLILTYPAAHLATVIALRNILGPDLLKIAGILDSLASDPPSSTSRPRTTSSAHPLSNQATSSPPRKSSLAHSYTNSIRSRPPHRSNISENGVSFSKANYLLPSIATEVEISSFLSGITKPLIEKSPFYTPEPELPPVIVEKIVEKFIERPALPPPQTPTQSSSQPPVSFRTPKEPRESKISRLTGENVSSPRSRGHAYAASISSTVRTTGTERVRRDGKLDDGWGNFYVGEEDSEDDAYDRMIMGRAGARIVPEVKQLAGKKRSSKKALKWLGLA